MRMYQVTQHSEYKIEFFTGLWPKVRDLRMDAIEAVVAKHYNVDVSSLTTWYNTHESKYMCAFLQHHLLNHSLKYLSKHYGIYYYALRDTFCKICERSVVDATFKKELNSLKTLCINNISGNTSGNQNLKNVLKIELTPAAVEITSSD